MFIEIASKLCFLWFPVVSLCCNLQVHVNVCTFKSTRAHVRTRERTHKVNLGPCRCSGGGALCGGQTDRWTVCCWFSASPCGHCYELALARLSARCTLGDEVRWPVWGASDAGAGFSLRFVTLQLSLVYLILPPPPPKTKCCNYHPAWLQ